MIADRPVRAGLRAFRAHLEREALEGYRSELLVWATLAPHRKHPIPAPAPPSILGSPERSDVP